MARLPERTQLLALALLNHADDEGFFPAEPAIVRGACAPFREDLATIREDLARLRAAGWIEVQEHQDHGPIGLIANWSRHQKVDHPRPSRLKAYFIRDIFATPREGLALEQGTGNREQGSGNDAVAVVVGPETPAASAATPVIHRVSGPDPAAITAAVAAGDLQAVVSLFGCTGGTGEWQRDAGGLSLAMVVVLLDWRRRRGDPIRLPSGLRHARAEWRLLSEAEAMSVAIATCAPYGLPKPRLPALGVA